MKKINLNNIHLPTNYTLPDLKIIDKDIEYYASAYYERLAKLIIEFEEQLNENEEVGAKLVTFGETMVIHIDSIGYWNPRIIIFSGFDMQGQKVKLIQHVNQLSVLFISLPRTTSDRERIGFKLKKELKNQENK